MTFAIPQNPLWQGCCAHVFFRDWNMCCCVALPGSDSIENQLANWSTQGFLSMALCFRWTDSVVIGRKLLTSRRPLLAPETPRFSTRTFHIHCSQFREAPSPFDSNCILTGGVIQPLTGLRYHSTVSAFEEVRCFRPSAYRRGCLFCPIGQTYARTTSNTYSRIST